MADKIFAFLAAMVLVIVIGLLAHQELNTSRVTVAIQLKKNEDPFLAFRSLLPPDTAIVEIREVDKLKNEYRVTVKTHAERTTLLERLRHHRCVENVVEIPANNKP